jgi:hypothetical protein
VDPYNNKEYMICYTQKTKNAPYKQEYMKGVLIVNYGSYLAAGCMQFACKFYCRFYYAIICYRQYRYGVL